MDVFSLGISTFRLVGCRLCRPEWLWDIDGGAEEALVDTDVVMRFACCGGWADTTVA